ncbi:MAG: hypothetical protein K2G23_09475, partial [Muribaculaceae bacterium]|nr:hypothetical protein [Muribaculaceae bacterium]
YKNRNKYIPLAALMSIALASGLSFSSCGSKKISEEAATDSARPDTVRADTIPAVQDSIRTYYSDDLKSFGIKGNVLKRSRIRHDAGTVYPIPAMELTFDSLGNFTGSLEGLYAKNNDEGFHYLYSMNYEDGTSWELTYTELNEEGYPIKAEIIESGPQGTANAVVTYYGYEYDRTGNWVMRSATMSRDFIETETEEKTSTFHKWKELVSYTYNEEAGDNEKVTSNNEKTARKRDFPEIEFPIHEER